MNNQTCLCGHLLWGGVGGGGGGGGHINIL